MKDSPWVVHITIHVPLANADSLWYRMPSGNSFLFESDRHIQRLDFWGFSQARLKVNKQAVAGAPGSKLILSYSPVFMPISSYRSCGAEVGIDVANTYLDSDWVLIPEEVRAYDDLYIAIIGSGGNDSASPRFGAIAASFQ